MSRDLITAFHSLYNLVEVAETLKKNRQDEVAQRFFFNKIEHNEICLEALDRFLVQVRKDIKAAKRGNYGSCAYSDYSKLNGSRFSGFSFKGNREGNTASQGCSG